LVIKIRQVVSFQNKKKDRAVGKNALQRVQMMIGGIVYFIVMNNDA